MEEQITVDLNKEEASQLWCLAYNLMSLRPEQWLREKPELRESVARATDQLGDDKMPIKWLGRGVIVALCAAVDDVRATRKVEARGEEGGGEPWFEGLDVPGSPNTAMAHLASAYTKLKVAAGLL